MPAVDKVQAGFKDEVTWGTPVTVDRFGEFNTEKLLPVHDRVKTTAMRSGHRVRRSDRQVPYIKGGLGPVEIPVLAKGFGFWLKHMLGGIATTGPVDAKYVHTASIGAMTGLGFTYQTNRPFHPANTDQAITFEGGKIPKWTISNKVGEELKVALEMDFEHYSTATGLAVASYPTAAEALTFQGGVITVGGSGVDVLEAMVSCDNKLFGLTNTDSRRYLRGNTQHREPVEGDFRDVQWSFKTDWSDLTQFNRFASLTAAGALATIVLTWTGNILIGSASFPTLVVTIQNASFDGFTSTIDNPQPLQQALSGAGLYDGSISAVTIAYGTADATP